MFLCPAIALLAAVSLWTAFTNGVFAEKGLNDNPDQSLKPIFREQARAADHRAWVGGSLLVISVGLGITARLTKKASRPKSI
jgi:hypothetical protein